MNYQVCQYNKLYKTSVLDLLKHMWQNNEEEQIRRKFEWRYEQNPDQNIPYIFIALDKESKVVGFRAFVVQEFCKGAIRIKIFNPADAIIHPKHRRKGLFSKLTNALIELISNEEKNAIVLNLSSNTESTYGYLKLGWSLTNGQRMHAYKISPKHFVVKSSQKSIDKVEQDTKSGTIVVSSKVELGQISTFEKMRRGQYILENYRSKDYYNWRYIQAPDKNKYYSAYLKSDRIKAYIILKRISGNQFSLDEYDAHSVLELRQLIKKVVDILNISILRTWMLNKSDQKLLAKCGFIRERQWILKMAGKKRLPLLVRPAVLQPNEEDLLFDGLDIRDMNNWRIQKADSH